MKARRKRLKELERRIPSERNEYNEKYAVMPYLPKAVQLKKQIDQHKKEYSKIKEEYNKIKSELGSKKNG